MVEASLQLLAFILEPVYASAAARKARDNALVDVAALVSAPGDETGAPLYPAGKPYQLKYGSPPTLPSWALAAFICSGVLPVMAA